ncbi:hypothetical protein BD311DRAFT_747674 [Dichomitus squalens]|uniref:Ubiquitin 3 binding protein But2 C-terminal domain-containing protein n=1 Tax=Dichomitus squalens TaxID=114155 RepID=A0A4Q9N1D9_9APHY|nr:hypothetical protein BD311DRAFT_747674 [Dichomitus squalens]
MKSIVAVLASAAIAATSYASVLPHRKSVCAGAKTVSNTSIAVGDKVVELVELSCGSAPVRKRQNINLFGDVCETECFTGDTAPATEDCQTIFNAIMSISSVTPTFQIAGDAEMVLTSGTCQFFFDNDEDTTGEFCWTSFAQTASAIGSACFSDGATEAVCFSNTEPFYDIFVTHS